MSELTLLEKIEQPVVTRRQFLKFAGIMASVLALPMKYAPVLAEAMASGKRLPVIWLEFQDCTGDTESFLRAAPRTDPLQANVKDPGITELLLDFISLEYHETIMSGSGTQSKKSLDDAIAANQGKYILVVEGSIPLAQNGVYCMVNGETAVSILQRVAKKALGVVAAGSCAFDGGLAAAAPNPTGADGVRGAFPGVSNLVNLPGCPVNAVNMVATLVFYLTFNRWPDMDSNKRPYFAYGQEIHDHCERHDFYENDQFVLSWDDDGAKKGWCLFKMGCKGPKGRANCASIKWNQGTSFPIQAGHGCIGCTTSHFWDNLGPVYTALKDD
jgi:hydrogenase small subunit